MTTAGEIRELCLKRSGAPFSETRNRVRHLLHVAGVRKFLVLLGLLLSLSGSVADTALWPEALAGMPLQAGIRQLNRTNCVEVMLAAFQSNSVVKGLIFMPGATDEFYMFRRARATLPGERVTLLDAVVALTNQTFIRATFRSPLLLLHTQEDSLEPDTIIRNERTARELKTIRKLPHVLCNDRDWDYLQPILRWSLKADLRPWRNSPDSWHFYRHSFVAWDLTGWEALEAAALAGKSKFTVKRNEVDFEIDRRFGVSPGF